MSSKTRKLKDRERNKDKNKNDKNKEKEGILCEAGAFYTVQGMFWAFHAWDSHMFESILFKMLKIFPIFCIFFVHFCSFSVFYALFSFILPFTEKASSRLHALEYRHMKIKKP